MTVCRYFYAAALAIVLGFGAMPAPAHAQQGNDQEQQGEEQERKDPLTLEQLLEQVRSATYNESREHQQRIQAFQREKQQQQARLARARAELQRERATNERLEATVAANDLRLDALEKQLAERLGELKELFGHLTGAAGDARETIDGSIVSAQHPGRTDFIAGMVERMSSSTELPTVEEVERLWGIIFEEIVESGKVVRFDAEVANPDGEVTTQSVVRVGNYNLISDGQYLAWSPSTGRIERLPSQPAGRYLGQAGDLEGAVGSADMVRFGVDPTGPIGGTFLKAIIGTPTLYERWQQGRTVGYIISLVGLFSMLIAIWRWWVLAGVSSAVDKQLKDTDKAMRGNPLGRIMAVYADNRSVDVETLELKLNEAIIKERPAIEAWLNTLKIIAAVAPLMGLLGTVTGMIATFQGIALYGAGDVQGMAGGISQALVTTVLGLIVAIPTVLLYTLLNSKAMRLTHILEEQAAGIVAEKAQG